MSKYLALYGIFLAFSACRPTPFQVKPVSPGAAYKVQGLDAEKTQIFSAEEKQQLEDAYKKAGSPVIGLINGYYRLPNAEPFGAATLVEGFGYNAYVKKLELKGREQPFAITPVEGQEALALNHALNSLLAMNVKIKEISMSDALTLAEAEQQAVEKKGLWALNNYLPPSVDLLLSIYKTHSDRGALLVGRMIAKDGRLLAFKVVDDSEHESAMNTLILSLFKEAVYRL